MKKDYSDYQFTAYDEYRYARSNHENVKLAFFSNTVSFVPKERSFFIHVCPRYEYYSMYEGLAQYDLETEAALRRKLDDENSPEDKAELNRDCAEAEKENAELLRTMSAKYQINREQADNNRRFFYSEHPELPVEPLINIFSESNISMNYGEGILDFVYADFSTPLKKEMTFLRKIKHLWKTPSQEKPESIRNKTQADVENFFDYQGTFSTIRDVAYASMYSAICPPKFDSSLLPIEELKWYGNYLLTLQKEYLELIEFCFDETLYSDALGSLYPSERYALYRDLHGLPPYNLRKEILSFSTWKISDSMMPYGMPSTDFLKRIGGSLKSTEDAVALACKFGIPLNALLTRIQVPRFINVQYHFSSIADILELEFTKMLEQNIHFRKCKRCGKYFIMKGNYDTNYCSRIPHGGTRTCQELAAAEKYKAKIADDKAIPIYNRYYKRYAARVRVRQIKEADFKKWKYQAIRLRDDCSAGKISPEEFTQWMEDSFPNRKPKT